MNKMLILAVWLAICLAAGGAWADSIFYVDGLAVDDMEAGAGDRPAGDTVFKAGVTDGPLNQKFRSLSIGAGSESEEPAPGLVRRESGPAEEAQWGKRLDETLKLLESEPDNVALLGRAASLAALTRRFDLADRIFPRYLQARPADATFLVGYAGVLMRLGRLDEAQTMVDRALAADVRNLAAHFNRLVLRLARGEPPDDQQEWETLTMAFISLVAGWLDADRQDLIGILGESKYLQLCDITLGAGTGSHIHQIATLVRAYTEAAAGQDWAKAEVIIRQVLQMGVAGAGPSRALTRCLYERGYKNDARELLRQLAAKYPGQFDLQFNYGLALIDTGDYSGAEKAFERARQIDPANPQGAFALACAYAAQDQMDRAWSLLQDLADTHPELMPGFMDGAAPYLKAIRADPRYPALMQAAREKAAP